MEATLVGLVFVHKAYIAALWLMAEFRSQGPPLATWALQAKFKNILKDYRDKHGLPENGERSNISAINEDPSELFNTTKKYNTS
jgi:hypothetical protein